MRDQALFINGIFRVVLDDIVKVQSEDPEQILFLQPFTGTPIVMLRNNPPEIEDPVRLYASTSDDLAHVFYTAEVVLWEDKTTMSQTRRDEVENIIRRLQPTEGGVYNASRTPGEPSRNLLSVRRMLKLPTPAQCHRVHQDQRW